MMKQRVWRLGVAVLCSLGLWSEGVLAMMPSPRVPSLEMTQGNGAEEFQRLFDEGRQFLGQGTAQGYREAIIRFEQALAVAERLGAIDGIALASIFLGRSHNRLAERQVALNYYQTALDASREIEHREWEAASLNNIGGVYDALGNRSEALNYYHQALPIYREVGDRNGEAATLNNMGAVYDALGNRSEALNYYHQALPIVREVGNRNGEARTLNNIGMVYNALGNRSEALNYYHQALPIRREVGDRSGEATTLNNMGAVYNALGNRSEALNYFNQALPIVREVGNRNGEATTLNNIGMVYSALGNRSEALNYYRQALPIQREVGNRSGEASTINNIGAVYSALGNRSEALNYYRQALPIQREVGNRSGEASTLNNIGAVYSALGNRSEALNYYRQALPIRREVGDRSGEASTLNNIGAVYSALGNRSEALNYYRQALSIDREVGDRNGEASTLNNIGMVYHALGNRSEALNYLNQALPIYKEVGDRNGEASTLNNIGGVYNSLGNRSEALNHFNQALPIVREVGNRDGEAGTLNNIAWIHYDQNDLPSALEHIEAAIEIVEQLRGEITSTDLRTSYFATVQDYYELKIEVLMQLHQQQPEQGYDRRAFNTSERTRARTLIELLQEANLDIQENVNPQLRQREQNLRQQLRAIDAQRVAQLQVAQDNDEIQAIAETADQELNTVLRELDRLATELRETSPAYAALQYPQPLNVEQVQRQVLDPDTTLVQYSLGTEGSYVWVITPDSFQTYSLPGREEIEAAARNFYSSLVNAGNLPITIRDAQRLSQEILAPIIDQLDSPRLLIVPDGILHQIPFSALATPNRENYEPLLVNYELVSAPSSTVIATNREVMGERPPAPNLLALLADPVFNGDDPRVTRRWERQSVEVELSATLRSFDLQGVPRLPHSRREAEQLLALAEGNSTRSVFDFEANSSWVTSHQASQHQFVHFATHGFINDAHPELSGLVLSLIDANGESKNGFLRLVDIFNLRLPAELVVLSACQTGLGDEVRGEGVVGLTRGLMYAGAKRTMVSLWDVSDEKTADLMVSFYGGVWREGLTPVAALRQAQLQMWQAGEHPAYWAAFGVQGEWQP